MTNSGFHRMIGVGLGVIIARALSDLLPPDVWTGVITIVLLVAVLAGLQSLARKRARWPDGKP